MKIFHFDVETTGTDPKRHDIVQLAYMIEIDGVDKEEGSLFMQPFDFDSINCDALAVNKLTIEQLRSFDNPRDVYTKVCKLLSKYVDKYDRKDKFPPAGYNVGFDCDFFKEWFAKNGDVYYGSWFNWKQIDPLRVLYFMDGMGVISLPDYKLETVCKHYGIEIDAHEALSDVKATRELIRILSKYFKGENRNENQTTKT
jgi:DNA polymerase III alpha subunit (gram-positive type)